MRQVNVYFNDIKAGVLTEQYPGREYTFVYDDAYYSSVNPPVSVTLPKKQRRYTSEHLFPFFSNMLPEGGNRRVVCRALHIDEHDIFGILMAMSNKDFIGSVNIRNV